MMVVVGQEMVEHVCERVLKNASPKFGHGSNLANSSVSKRNILRFWAVKRNNLGKIKLLRLFAHSPVLGF